MRVKCVSGHEFDVPAGVSQAKCPKCGQNVEVKAGQDWLAGVDVDNLSLEESAAPEAAKASQAGPAAKGPQPGPKPAPRAPQAGPAPGQAGPQAVGPQPPSVGRPSAAQGALRVGTRAAGPEKPAVLGPPPTGVAGLVRILKEDAKGAIPYLQEGIRGKSFIVQLAAVLVVLALLAATARTWSDAPRGFSAVQAAKRLVILLVEMAASGVLFSLVAVLLKREAKPLGMCEALAVVRGGALVILTGASVVLGLLLLLTAQPEAAPAARAPQTAPAARAPQAAPGARAPQAGPGAPRAGPRPSVGAAVPAQGARPQPAARAPQAGPAPRSRQAETQGAILPLLLWARGWFWAVYFVPVVVGQMFFVMNLLKLGCWPTVIGNIVATYAAYALAQRVGGSL